VWRVALTVRRMALTLEGDTDCGEDDSDCEEDGTDCEEDGTDCREDDSDYRTLLQHAALVVCCSFRCCPFALAVKHCNLKICKEVSVVYSSSLDSHTF
jgi:hypothetical protein